MSNEGSQIFSKHHIKHFFLKAVKEAIVNKHNELRIKVANGQETEGVSGAQPPAANMRKLVWNDELAEVAQR